MNPDDPKTIAGEVSVDEFWERIDYFLERAVPAAESAKVRMACHPHDPYTPDGYMLRRLELLEEQIRQLQRQVALLEQGLGQRQQGWWVNWLWSPTAPKALAPPPPY